METTHHDLLGNGAENSGDIPELKTFQAAYQLGYANGYCDAGEEEYYNEDFSGYEEFFDEEEDFDLQDFDDSTYQKKDLPLE